MTTQNPWAGFLEEEPKSAYFSYQNQFGGPSQAPKQKQFFQDQFANIYNQYLGQLGMQIGQGDLPSKQWQDYMKDFDFSGWYKGQVPYDERNAGFNKFSPQTQWQVGPKYG